MPRTNACERCAAVLVKTSDQARSGHGELLILTVRTRSVFDKLIRRMEARGIHESAYRMVRSLGGVLLLCGRDRTDGAQIAAITIAGPIFREVLGWVLAVLGLEASIGSVPHSSTWLVEDAGDCGKTKADERCCTRCATRGRLIGRHPLRCRQFADRIALKAARGTRDAQIQRKPMYGHEP